MGRQPVGQYKLGLRGVYMGIKKSANNAITDVRDRQNFCAGGFPRDRGIVGEDEKRATSSRMNGIMPDNNSISDLYIVDEYQYVLIGENLLICVRRLENMK
ncbi:hypothetical protein Trydic_g9332 [Trypoxylus dichotomus]